MALILLTNKYSPRALAIAKKELPSGFSLKTLKIASKEELIKAAPKADFFLVSGQISIDKDVIAAAPNLKMVQRTGVGLDTIDLENLKKRGIPVYVNYGVNSSSVAEHTILLIMSVLRRLPAVDCSVRQGKWLRREMGLETEELKGKTVGLIGVGGIGNEVAKLLKPFNVRLLYYKRTPFEANREKDLNISYRPFDRLLKEVNILSLHCPLNSDTKGIIGEKEIKSMQQGSIIINTARGKLIDEKGLINALKTGHIKGAGLDVFNDEPLDPNNPLAKLPNVVLTPHLGGITLNSFQKMMAGAFANIKLFAEGQESLIENKRVIS